jgi:hypothetical protein
VLFGETFSARFCGMCLSRNSTRQMLAEPSSIVDISLDASRILENQIHGRLRVVTFRNFSVERDPAIYVDGLAGHGAGLIGAKEERGTRNLFRRLRAALQQSIEKAG